MEESGLIYSPIYSHTGQELFHGNDVNEIVHYLETSRQEVSKRLEDSKRTELGQFFTPISVARLMVSMFDEVTNDDIHIIDAGAGIGTLFSALILRLCTEPTKPKKISMTAYEIEPVFFSYLDNTIRLCRDFCERHNVVLEAVVNQEDFIASVAYSKNQELLRDRPGKFTHAILNPPYHKIKSDSQQRKLLRSCGIETGNLYTAFMALSSQLLMDGGEMVSITPRSFCNGVYFKSFRKKFLEYMKINKMHLFHSRREVFKDDDVLQENIIIKTNRSVIPQEKIQISYSVGIDEKIKKREVDQEQVVSLTDKDAIIHITTEELDSSTTRANGRFVHTLQSLGFQVSTGPVVDFRARKYIVPSTNTEVVPLIYPFHFDGGYVAWPAMKPKKPDGILAVPETKTLLLPSQCYVVVKRFSSKEQEKRVMAALYDPNRFENDLVGFENHLNYYHNKGNGLNITVAKGLTAFLNSSMADSMFRLFSGHTQVNADDLRRLKYPSLDELEAIGREIGTKFPNQDGINKIVEQVIFLGKEP